MSKIMIGTDTFIKQWWVITTSPVSPSTMIQGVFSDKLEAFDMFDGLEKEDKELSQVIMVVYKGMFSTPPAKRTYSTEEYD